MDTALRGETWVEVGAVEWMDDFAAWLERGGRSARTVASYCQDVRVFVGWFERTYEGLPFEPGQMTGVDLRAWREYSLTVERAAASTWNRRRSALAMFCEWAQACGQSTTDVFEGVLAADDVELAPRWLEPGEQQRFMRQVELAAAGAKTMAGRRQALRDAAMAALMIYGGLREGEVCNLRVMDVTVGERSGKAAVLGKRNKKRDVPLGRECRRWVSLWLAVREGDGADLLFTGKGSDGVSTRTVQRVVAEIGRRAGLAVTPHDLRHTCAKRLLDKGTPLTVIQRLLGHARLDTTGRYVQPSLKDLERAVE